MRASDAATQDFKIIQQYAPVKSLIDHMAKDMAKTIFVVDKKGMISGVIRPIELNKVILSEGRRNFDCA